MLPPWFVPWCSLAVLINAFSSPADRDKQATKPSHSILASLSGVNGFSSGLIPKIHLVPMPHFDYPFGLCFLILSDTPVLPVPVYVYVRELLPLT